MKKSVSGFLLPLLLISTVTLTVSYRPVDAYQASATTKVRAISDVPSLGPNNVVGRRFKVALVIESVTDLYGFDIQVNWTANYIRHVNHTVTVPSEDYPAPNPPSSYNGTLHKPILPVKDIVNESKSIPDANPQAMAWFVYVSMYPALPQDGNAVAVIFTFEVFNQPLAPFNTTIVIHFVETTLSAYGGVPITHDTIDLQIPLYGRTLYDIELSGVLYKTVLSQGRILNFNVTVFNRGSYTETFNVSVYVNSTLMYRETVTLQNWTSTLIMFRWNTTSWAMGTYHLTALADPVPGETDISDNSFESWVTVTIAGDVNGDFEVGILDIVRITNIYGSRMGNPQFNPNSDLNDDKAISMLDVVLCTTHYGDKYS